MEKELIAEFEKESNGVLAIDHNGNYDYRYVEFLYSQIEAFESSFKSALRIIDNLRIKWLI